jgi:hypothetical protein
MATPGVRDQQQVCFETCRRVRAPVWINRLALGLPNAFHMVLRVLSASRFRIAAQQLLTVVLGNGACSSVLRGLALESRYALMELLEHEPFGSVPVAGFPCWRESTLRPLDPSRGAGLIRPVPYEDAPGNPGDRAERGDHERSCTWKRHHCRLWESLGPYARAVYWDLGRRVIDPFELTLGTAIRLGQHNEYIRKGGGIGG